MGYDRGDCFPFDFEPNGIPFGSKSKGKLSPRSYPIQCERKWKYSFLSADASMKCAHAYVDTHSLINPTDFPLKVLLCEISRYMLGIDTDHFFPLIINQLFSDCVIFNYSLIVFSNWHLFSTKRSFILLKNEL